MVQNSFFVFLALAIGCLVPYQAIINSQLAGKLGSPLPAALISFGGGFLIMVVVNLFSPAYWPALRKSASFPPYLFLGGLIGSAFVLSAIFIVPKLGSTALVGLVVAGQLLMSLFIDHYGILGAPITKISMMRISGTLLLFLGAVLLLKR